MAAGRRFLSGMEVAHWVLIITLIAGCGPLDHSSGPTVWQRRSEVLLDEDPGWEGVVRIDSLTWLPAMPLAGPTSSAETLEGTFAARFTNVGTRPVQIRYELRFYDADTFLLDSFFPFEQPVVLRGGESRRVHGEFRLDLAATAVMRLSTMQLAAHISTPEN